MDSIRADYRFESSCQKSVPQAIEAFLESESFEDAIRNVISIGGDCDTTGAITGSIAWTYYTVQDHSWGCDDHMSPALREIRDSARRYLPEEFVSIADEFHEACWRRGGCYVRTGGCSLILSKEELELFTPPEQNGAGQYTR